MVGHDDSSDRRNPGMETAKDGLLLRSADGKHLRCIRQREGQSDLPTITLDGTNDHHLLAGLLHPGATTPAASGIRR